MRSARILGMVLFLGLFVWIPAVMSDALANDPVSTFDAVFQMSVLFSPPLCLVGMMVMVRVLLKRKSVPESLYSKVRRFSFLAGPFGLLWAIFKLTECADLGTVR
jgi:low temperature requirement protein LtrA